ncbi:MAG: citramalate synthase [Candidatus Hydrogenedentes bacterium]|nr:citramalate synthase [Candidatus Hydrogenedentota bacterium]
MTRRIEIYDTTLRDGAQGPGIKFSSEDQLRVVRELDELGVAYIEGGQPGANPKAVALFERTRDMELKHAKMAAFGSTRNPRARADEDSNLRALVGAGTEVVTIFAKTSPLHTREVLHVPLEKNMEIVRESVDFLRQHGKRVFLDAEHFFDGFRESQEYALEVLKTAMDAGAEVLVLCDTNGGSLPADVGRITAVVRRALPEARLGIHTHNDVGCGVANALAAVVEGADQVQGTINGYGERTGNANLCTVIPNLQIKMGLDVVTREQLARLWHVSHFVAEMANQSPRDFEPYVGRDAFTHKGGMHADAVRKFKASYEHVDPAQIGNRTIIAVSEVSGRSSLLEKAEEFGIPLDRDQPETRKILARIKDLENQGYEFEGADASLELEIRRATGTHQRFFKTLRYHAGVWHRFTAAADFAEATVKLEVDGQQYHTVAEGNGPVDALNKAMRQALEGRYPELRDVRLEDYKVRILDGKEATRAKTRVLIESADNEGNLWNTVGVSENIITASYLALVDSFEYRILKSRGRAQGMETA